RREGDDVRERARCADLAGELQHGVAAGGAARDDELLRARDDPPLALARPHLLARSAAHRVHRPGAVDAQEIVAIPIGHPLLTYQMVRKAVSLRRRFGRGTDTY